jgi:hypothetical protein
MNNLIIDELTNAIEENAFFYYLRQNLEWDDDLFMNEITIVKKCLQYFKNEKVIPKIVVYYFCQEISLIIGHISNPDFFQKCTEQEKKMINERKKLLEGMQARFFNGDLYTDWQ